MSLIVNGSTGTTMEPIPEGTHQAVCNMMIDLGMQRSEQYKTTSRKVIIGWELPNETFESEGKEVPRQISKRYTASLNEKANLRQDLAAWRGKDFTPEELAAFDLRNIVGVNCFINIIHAKGQDGRTYANINSVMALPKGITKIALSHAPTILDLDTCTAEDIEALPKWIADTIKKSETYAERFNSTPAPAEAAVQDNVVQFHELEDDGDLPF